MYATIAVMLYSDSIFCFKKTLIYDNDAVRDCVNCR